MPVGEKQTYRFGPFELDTRCGQLRKDGVGLKLQGQPVQILEILLEKPGQLVTRDELHKRLWASDTFVDFDNSLNTAIKKLRHALGDEADTHRYIETLPRRGYRFVSEVTAEDVRHENHNPSPIAADDVVRQVVTNLADAAITAGTESRSRTRQIRVVMGSVVAFLGIATSGYWITKPPPLPRIVGSHALTKTGNPKWFLTRPFTDRGSLYFIDESLSGPVILQVPTAGGEVSPGPTVNGYLRDISRDRSQLLSQTFDPKRNYGEVWTQSLPTGLPRLVVKDAVRPIWSADGRGIFFFRVGEKVCDTALLRANADGTAVERLATVPCVYSPHLSPDGTRIRFTEGSSSADRLWEVGTDGSNPHPILGGRKVVYGGDWRPDGKYYFFTAWDGDRMSLWASSEARHWWRRNTAAPQQLTFGPMSIGAPAVSNDGKQLYAVGAERHGELSVYDRESGKFIPYLGGISVCCVDFSRDAQWVAYVSYPEGTLWRSRIDGSEKRQLTSPPLAVMNPRWSPDGKLIAFVDYSNGDRSQMARSSPRRVYVVSADGGGPTLLLAGQFADPTWSPDGNSIAYDYNAFSADWATEVRILDLQTEISTKVPGSERMWSPRWSPDGKYLAALGPQDKLMLYTFATKTWEELDSGGHGWPCWSPDSKFIYSYARDSLVRVAISDHKTEKTASLQGFRGTAYYYDRWNLTWSGATPDGRPLALRDTGIQELYAFDLEYK